MIIKLLSERRRQRVSTAIEVPGDLFPEAVLFNGHVFLDAHAFFRGVKGEYLEVHSYDGNDRAFAGLPRGSAVHQDPDLRPQARAIADDIDARLAEELSARFPPEGQEP